MVPREWILAKQDCGRGEMNSDSPDKVSHQSTEKDQEGLKTIADVAVVGRRGSLASLVLQALVAGVLLTSIFRDGSSNIALFVLALLAYNLATSVAIFFCPPRLAIERGQFALRLLSTTQTPASNVADLEFSYGRLLIRFHDSALVEPSKQGATRAETFRRHGYHLSTLPGVFSLEQINALRSRLGLPIQEEDGYTAFLSNLQRLIPRVLVTPAIITGCVVVFLLMAIEGDGLVTVDTKAAIDWGANYVPLTSGGQWWRLVTSLFLHFGVLHLLFNMWVLSDVGRLVERLVGHTGIAMGYLISGFVGSVTSLLWHDATVSAGASGAVFGVFGMLLGFMVFQRNSVPIQIAKEHRSQALAFVAFNVLFGFSIPWIDQAAHLGGFAAGFLCGLVLNGDLNDAVVRRSRRNWILGMSGLVVAALAVMQLPPRNHAISYLGVRIDAVDQAAVAVYQVATKKLVAGRASPRQVAEQLRTEIVPSYLKVAAELQGSRANETRQQQLKSAFIEYVSLRRQGWELLAEAVESQDIVREGMAIEKFELARAALAEFNPKREDKQNAMPTDLRTEVAVFAVRESRAMETYKTLMQQAEAGGLDDPTLARRIEEDVLTIWDEGKTRWMAAQAKLSTEEQQTGEQLTKYLELQREGWVLQVESLREQDDTKRAGAQVKFDEAARAAEQIWQPQADINPSHPK